MCRSAVVSLALACLVAGCGGERRELNAWAVEPPYIPPPDPRVLKAPPSAEAPRSSQPRASGPSAGAPSDTEVERDLERALNAREGTSAKRLIDAAGLTPDGLATVPPAAPPQVADIIRAANQVARRPYVYGGGHGRLAGEIWIDTAYDCSGSVSFALANAGFLDAPLDSTRLARFGRPGPGRWVTIYANAGHAFMTVAGLRFDTSGRREGGSRWQATQRSVAGFTARHPPGL